MPRRTTLPDTEFSRLFPWSAGMSRGLLVKVSERFSFGHFCQATSVGWLNTLSRCTGTGLRGLLSAGVVIAAPARFSRPESVDA